MKSVLKALIIQAALAQQEQEGLTSGPLVEFDKISDGRSEQSGSIREFKLEYEDESGDSHVEIWLEVFWRVGGDEYNTYWFQNYLEMEDINTLGTYMSVTCSALYDSNNDSAQEVIIKNYYSKESIRTLANNINGKKLD